MTSHNHTQVQSMLNAINAPLWDTKFSINNNIMFSPYHYVATQNAIEMSSSVRNHDQPSEIEESQMTTLTLVTSQGPAAPSSSDIAEEKLNELHRAFSISPSHSTDYMEMSGAATGKKMGKAERNLLERSATSLSSHSSVGGTPKRAKYNPYHYDSLAPNSAAQQVDSGSTDQERRTTTTAVSKKSDQEPTSTGTSASTTAAAATPNTPSTIAASNPASAGGAGTNGSCKGTTTTTTTTTAEKLCNGREDGGGCGKDMKERALEPDSSG